MRGLGWLDCDDDGLWALDDGAVRTEKRVRRAIDGGEAGVAARKGVRTAGVARELAGELDSPLDKWGAADVLGLPNGRALDLATGEVRRAQPSERVYQRLAVAPEAGEPIEWLRVLGETFSQLEKTEEMIAYLRWWLRYSLGRSCADESALFLVGPPGAGKSRSPTLGRVSSGASSARPARAGASSPAARTRSTASGSRGSRASGCCAWASCPKAGGGSRGRCRR